MEPEITDDKKTEAFEKLLSSNLNRVVDLLKFAEAKNGALLTFSSAWILGMIALYSKSTPTLFGKAYFLGIGLFAVAAGMSIFSFIPRISLARFYTEVARSNGLLFFGDIAKLDIDEFRNRSRERYLDSISANENYLDDLCVQIAINSKIARRKFLSFNVGACFALVAIALITAPVAWRSIVQ